MLGLQVESGIVFTFAIPLRAFCCSLKLLHLLLRTALLHGSARKFRRTLIDWQRVSNHWMNWHAKDGTSSASISDYDWSMALTMTDCCPWAGDDSMSSRRQAQQVTQCSAWRTRSCIAQEVPQTATAKNLFVFIFIHHFLRVSNVDIRKAQGLEVQWKSSRMSVDQCRTFWQHMTTSGSQANPLHNGHWNSEILAGRREQPLSAQRANHFELQYKEMISDTDTIWYGSYIFRYELSLTQE